MLSVATETGHAEAIRSALEVPLGKWSAYDYDDVPEVLPNLYALVTVSKRFGAPIGFAGGKPVNGYRLTTLAVGRTVEEARWIRDLVAGAIEDQKLTIDGLSTTRVRLETEQPIEPDDGRYSGLTAWTYAL
jgi:hypothetical protein